MQFLLTSLYMAQDVSHLTMLGANEHHHGAKPKPKPNH